MKSSISRNTAGALALGILATGGATLVEAREISETKGLVDYFLHQDLNETSVMKDAGLQFGGWVNFGVTYNTNNAPGNFNGPVTFGDRSGEFQMNQLYLYLQRAVNTEGDAWDVGFRADFMYGTDAVFTQAYGCPNCDWDYLLVDPADSRFYNVAIPQAYLELFAPFGNGISAKIGHFYTIIGNEVVTAPDNFFYSHAYTMQYGEPFTHTGILFSYPITQNWSASAGAITGSQFGAWDGGFNRNLETWGAIGGVTWTSDDKGTSFYASGTTSAISPNDSSYLSIYSLVAKHDIMEDLHFTIQHDHGFANGLAPDGGDATWYGINTYLTYDISDDLAVGIRGEWFRDDDGIRVAGLPARTLLTGEAAFPGNPPAGSYYAFTAGLNWKPLSWVTVRPNVRYDWSDKVRAFNNGGQDVNYAGNRLDQFLFSTDVVLMF